MKKLVCLSVLLFILFPLIALTGDLHKVTRIIDGDTIVLDNGETVRLIGVDAPELSQPLSEDAALFLEVLLLNQSVRLEFDKDKKDKYDRTLAYVYLGDILINAKLLEMGYARVLTKYPFAEEFKSQFLKLQEKAKSSKLGIWKQSKEESPSDDIIVYVTKTGTKYHSAGCRYLSKSCIPIKLSEAKKRYSPCSVCNPPR